MIKKCIHLTILSAIAWCMVGVACAYLNNKSKEESKKKMTIVTFGDSTTAPRGRLKVYTDCLAEKFPENTFINAGIPGNTTEMGRRRFEKDVLEKKPDLVIIQFGINDSTVDVYKKTPATKSRVSKKRYEENLKFFIEKLKEKGVKVILMTPNRLCWTPKLKELYGKPPYDPNNPDGFNVMLDQYVDIVRRVAKEENVPLVDVNAEYARLVKDGNMTVKSLLLDGMHPNTKGQKLVADLLTKHLAGN